MKYTLALALFISVFSASGWAKKQIDTELHLTLSDRYWVEEMKASYRLYECKGYGGEDFSFVKQKDGWLKRFFLTDPQIAGYGTLNPNNTNDALLQDPNYSIYKSYYYPKKKPKKEEAGYYQLRQINEDTCYGPTRELIKKTILDQPAWFQKSSIGTGFDPFKFELDVWLHTRVYYPEKLKIDEGAVAGGQYERLRDITLNSKAQVEAELEDKVAVYSQLLKEKAAVFNIIRGNVTSSYPAMDEYVQIIQKSIAHLQTKYTNEKNRLKIVVAQKTRLLCDRNYDTALESIFKTKAEESDMPETEALKKEIEEMKNKLADLEKKRKKGGKEYDRLNGKEKKSAEAEVVKAENEALDKVIGPLKTAINQKEGELATTAKKEARAKYGLPEDESEVVTNPYGLPEDESEVVTNPTAQYPCTKILAHYSLPMFFIQVGGDVQGEYGIEDIFSVNFLKKQSERAEVKLLKNIQKGASTQRYQSYAHVHQVSSKRKSLNWFHLTGIQANSYNPMYRGHIYPKRQSLFGLNDYPINQLGGLSPYADEELKIARALAEALLAKVDEVGP